MLKKVLPLVIIILISLYVFLFSDFLSNLDSKKSVHLEPHLDAITIDEANKFINTYYIDYLDINNSFFTDSKNISNQTKLSLVFNLLLDTKAASQTKYEEITKDIFGNKSKLKHEDIILSKTFTAKYDQVNQVYTFDELVEFIKLEPYRKLKSVKTKKDIYEFSFYKFFISHEDEKQTVYSSYGDMMNKVNEIFIIDEKADVYRYIDSHYTEKIKDLNTYKYTMKKENKKPILLKYEKE